MKFDVGILASEPVPEIARQGRLAEALGHDTVWMTDTHLVCRELWVTPAAGAVATPGRDFRISRAGAAPSPRRDR